VITTGLPFAAAASMNLVLLGCSLILAAGLASLLFRRRATLADRVYGGLLAAGCAAGLLPALGVLGGGLAPAATLSGSLPGGPWAFGLDGLSAWFLLVVLGVGGCAGLFGIGYLAPERGHRPVSVAHALYALLLVALVGVVSAQAMMPFLTAWEVMALSAYLLIMFESERAEVRRAGFIYLVLTHVSTLALLVMFAVLGGNTGGRSFAELGAAGQLQAGARSFALACALVGFGLKAGAVPLHFWLPGAHASAPSHVSAVLSGVMLKMGIYGLLRALLLLGAPPAWLGWVLFTLGLASGVLGVLWALGERDLKRVLAYSSVENIGIILMGMGVGVLGVAYGQPAVALLGFAAALLHSLNHALFKSLLFLGAGTVLRATGTRLIDRLGGLGRELPWTAVAFGVGAVAIVGLPPLNGFVSEWVAVQGLLTGAGSRQAGISALLLLGVAGLGLIGALALACFSRVVGGVFLGVSRRPRAPAREPWSLVAPMLALTAACAAIGLAPIIAVRPAIATTMTVLLPTGVAPGEMARVLAGAAVPVGAFWLLMLLLAGAAWYLRRRAGQARQAAAAATWGCAYAEPTPRMQYTAGSFTAPLLLAFGGLAAPEVTRQPGSLETNSPDKVLDGLVRPLWHRARRVAAGFRPLQQGPVTRYLQYIVLTVFLLLAALFAAIVGQT
jgi:hydrogenase-4 component B